MNNYWTTTVSLSTNNIEYRYCLITKTVIRVKLAYLFSIYFVWTLCWTLRIQWKKLFVHLAICNILIVSTLIKYRYFSVYVHEYMDLNLYLCERGGLKLSDNPWRLSILTVILHEVMIKILASDLQIFE